MTGQNPIFHIAGVSEGYDFLKADLYKFALCLGNKTFGDNCFKQETYYHIANLRNSSNQLKYCRKAMVIIIKRAKTIISFLII